MSTEQNLRGVTGAHTTDGTPRGFTSLTPFIAVVDAAAALDFYTRTFGAALVDRTDMPGPDGTPDATPDATATAAAAEPVAGPSRLVATSIDT